MGVIGGLIEGAAWMRGMIVAFFEMLQAFMLWIWELVTWPIRTYLDYLLDTFAAAWNALEMPDISPIVNAVATANLWFPVYEGFVLFQAYLVIAGLTVTVRWVIKFIPFIGG